MDQESWDNLHNAIALGEAEPDRLNGRMLPLAGEMEDGESGESDADAEHESDDEFEDFSTTEPAVLPYPPTGEPASLPRPRTSMGASNPRKRAASSVPARPQKRIVVKAGSDEIAETGATAVTSPLASASVPPKKGTNETAYRSCRVR